jgi:two-component system aerobic respiration control protein ArcA
MSRNNTVLIVEPDAASRSALRSTLEGDGYTVVATGGASDALALMDSSDITLVVTELYLASKNERCQLPALRESAPETKVLAYTRHRTKKDRAWAIAERADGYVLKQNGEERLLEVAARLSDVDGRAKRRAKGPRKAH